MKKRTKYTTDVKKQHTVPRFLLDHFGFGKKNKKRKLFTYDKHNKRIFQQSVYDATTRNIFYNIVNHPEKASLEPLLGDIEGYAATAIKKIIKNRNLSALTAKEVGDISVFTVIQKSRTYHGLQTFKALMKPLADKIVAIGGEPNEVDALLSEENTEEQKNYFLKMILQQIEHAPQIDNKSWILYETTRDNPFYISDNPVSLHNDIDMPPYGNLGLAVKGIQIHLPLSSTLTLAFTCPSIKENAIRARDQLMKLRKFNGAIDGMLKNPNGLIEFADAYEKGTPVRISPDNVRFLNSLQVTFSEQYLFCVNNNFKLVEKMLADSDGYRKGIRPIVN